MVYFKILYYYIQKEKPGPITSHVTHSSKGLHPKFEMGTYKIHVKRLTLRYPFQYISFTRNNVFNA